MNFLSPPSATSRVSQRPGDDLDGLLSAFYQAQMPSPWPPLQLPLATALPPTRLVFWQRVKRSHLALAASVAILVLGQALFSGKLSIREWKPLDGSATEIGKVEPIAKDKTPQDPIDPKNVSTKDSLQLTPEGVGIQIDVDETNRY
jgi:hypothetical protein